MKRHCCGTVTCGSGFEKRHTKHKEYSYMGKIRLYLWKYFVNKLDQLKTFKFQLKSKTVKYVSCYRDCRRKCYQTLDLKDNGKKSISCRANALRSKTKSEHAQYNESHSELQTGRSDAVSWVLLEKIISEFYLYFSLTDKNATWLLPLSISMVNGPHQAPRRWFRRWQFYQFVNDLELWLDKIIWINITEQFTQNQICVKNSDSLSSLWNGRLTFYQGTSSFMHWR